MIKWFAARGLLLISLIFSMNTAVAEGAVHETGASVPLSEGQKVILCKLWEMDAYNDFFGELARLGVTISDVYYELNCSFGADEGMDLFRMSFVTPATTKISVDKLRRQLAKENPERLSCILTDIRKRSMNLMSYIVWRLRGYEEWLANERATTQPDEGKVSYYVRSIGALRSAEYYFRRHLIEHLTQHPAMLTYIDWQKDRLQQLIEAENNKSDPDAFDLEDYQTDLKDLKAAELALQAEIANNPAANPEGICPRF